MKTKSDHVIISFAENAMVEFSIKKEQEKLCNSKLDK
jgi:hypothetical protein